jgi:hypothetical protein
MEIAPAVAAAIATATAAAAAAASHPDVSDEGKKRRYDNLEKPQDQPPKPKRRSRFNFDDDPEPTNDIGGQVSDPISHEQTHGKVESVSSKLEKHESAGSVEKSPANKVVNAHINPLLSPSAAEKLQLANEMKAKLAAQIASVSSILSSVNSKSSTAVLPMGKKATKYMPLLLDAQVGDYQYSLHLFINFIY